MGEYEVRAKSWRLVTRANTICPPKLGRIFDSAKGEGGRFAPTVDCTLDRRR